MAGLLRHGRQLKQRQKGLLQNIFRFAMAQAQSTAIENEPRRFFFVERLAPATVKFRRVHANITIILFHLPFYQ